MESEQLLTQGEIFKDEILAGTESTNNPTNEGPEAHDHVKNLNESSPAELIPKSLILRIYDVLMNHRRKFYSPKLAVATTGWRSVFKKGGREDRTFAEAVRSDCRAVLKSPLTRKRSDDFLSTDFGEIYG